MNLLTEQEQKALELTGELAGLVRGIIGQGSQQEHDWAELASAIHIIQRYIMSQAACRAYPGQYRLLGKGIDENI